MSVAHPALSLLPADHFLLTALILNLTLLVQWSLVKRARSTTPAFALAVTEVPNSSWLEPFSRELAIRKTRMVSTPKRVRRPIHRPEYTQRKAAPQATPIIVREQLLL